MKIVTFFLTLRNDMYVVLGQKLNNERIYELANGSVGLRKQCYATRHNTEFNEFREVVLLATKILMQVL